MNTIAYIVHILILQKLVKKCSYLDVLYGMNLTCRCARNGEQLFCVYIFLLVCAFIPLLALLACNWGFCMYGIWWNGSCTCSLHLWPPHHHQGSRQNNQKSPNLQEWGRLQTEQSLALLPFSSQFFWIMWLPPIGSHIHAAPSLLPPPLLPPLSWYIYIYI